MIERTWEILGKPAIIRRNRIIQRKDDNPMWKTYPNIYETSTEEDFEVVKFIENSAPFSMLLGKPWIENDQA